MSVQRNEGCSLPWLANSKTKKKKSCVKHERMLTFSSSPCVSIFYFLSFPFSIMLSDFGEEKQATIGRGDDRGEREKEIRREVMKKVKKVKKV